VDTSLSELPSLCPEALQVGGSDTSLAAQLSLAAYRIHPTQDLGSRLLNTQNTPRPSLLAADAGFVNSVAFSPDRHTLASGNFGGTVRLWNVPNPTHPRPLGQPLSSGPGEGAAGGPNNVLSVAFSPDGHTLASSENDGTIQLWDVAAPSHSRPLGQPLTGDQVIDSMVFSRDGHMLVGGGTSGTNSTGTIKLWDVADLAHPRPVSQALTGTSNTTVTSMVLSPDGHTLASGNFDGTVRLWDIADAEYPRPIGQPLIGGGAQVNSVAFSRDGHTLASGSFDGTVRLWKVANPALLCRSASP
jgi:WD40 repeat protein